MMNLPAEWSDLTVANFPEDQERKVIWANNFVVEWIWARAGSSYAIASNEESMLLAPQVGARLSDAFDRPVPARSVAILPPGRYLVCVDEDGPLAVLATSRPDLPPRPGPRDDRVREVESPFVAKTSSVRVMRFDDIAYPPGNSRLKFIQSATMSINFVEYGQGRDRANLSPHQHDDFEQGSLTVCGKFVHHLRKDWGRDANQWREDQHLEVEGATLAVIPPGVIHTTEGVEGGQHMLFDIFAPPRQDFIAKGWVDNAADYEAVASVGQSSTDEA